MKILSIAIVSVFMIAPVWVLAHGEGVSYEESKEGYFIDVGYDVAEPAAGDKIRFDFGVTEENATATEPIFDDVWVRITNDTDIVFAGSISQPVFGPTGFTTTLYNAGSHEVFVRFQKSGKKVVETSFVLEVGAGEGERSASSLVPFVVAALFGGVLLGYIIRSMRQV